VTESECERVAAPAAEQGVEVICPRCRGRLREEATSLACTGCDGIYPVSGGVADLAPETELYWGELSPAEMGTAIEVAGREGYEAAARFAATYSPGLRQYLMSECRIDWLFHAIALDRGAACLDIGSGWGTLSRALTPFFREVWSLEIVKERLAFQRAFIQAEKITGLKLVRGSAIRLPFPDRSFDLVIANGIIQWVGLADHTRTVAELQDEFLRECWRVLRPSGTFVMGCENRFSFFNYFGSKDHSGLPFTSLMPRRVANWVVRRYRRTGAGFVQSLRTPDEWRDYRTHTHSIPGYERLLTRAGFSTVKGYWAYPSNNVPGLMGPVDDGRSLADLMEFATRNLDFRVEGTTFSRFFMRFRRVARIQPLMRAILRGVTADLFFIARPRADGERFPTLGERIGRYTVRWSGSNKLIWLGRDGSRRWVVKTRRFPENEAQVEREERLLAEHNGLDVAVEKHGEWTCYREPYLDAQPLDCLSREHNEQALEWLLAFQARTLHGVLEETAFAAEVRTWLARFCDQMPDDDVRRVATEDCAALLRLVAGQRLPVVAEHGDFWWRNILRRHNDPRLVVIDWQHFRDRGDPLFDFSLLSYTHWETWRHVHGGRPAARSPVVDHLIASFGARRQLPLELIYAYLPYAFIRRVVRSATLPRYDLINVFRRHAFPSAQ
jgi:ubiquinone/menaquinone biosynthesis C-methylase UbiE